MFETHQLRFFSVIAKNEDVQNREQDGEKKNVLTAQAARTLSDAGT